MKMKAQGAKTDNKYALTSNRDSGPKDKGNEQGKSGKGQVASGKVVYAE